MPYIDQIEVDSTIYDIRDLTARQQSIPSGGTVGQILKKNTNADYDVSWQTDHHTHSADDITSIGYLTIHPEGQPSIIPFINNDIAYLTKKGGTATVTFDGVAQTVNERVFDASPSYWVINNTSVTTIVFELTLHKVFPWHNTIYIDFGSPSFRAKNINIEVVNTEYVNDIWTEKASTTTNALGHYYVYFTHQPIGADNAGGGFNKIRITLSNFATISTSGLRIAQIGVYNYNSYGLRETYLPKDGGELYGTIQPYSNNGANLGTASKYFNSAYITNINGVAVGNSPKFTDTKYTVTTDTVGSASAGTAITADDITSWSTGTLPSATVTGENLTLNFGTLPSLAYTEKTIPNISVTSKTVATGIIAS